MLLECFQSLFLCEQKSLVEFVSVYRQINISQKFFLE